MSLIPPEPSELATKQDVVQLWMAVGELQGQVTKLAEQLCRFLELYKEKLQEETLP
jgi:hypothetical protein